MVSLPFGFNTNPVVFTESAYLPLSNCLNGARHETYRIPSLTEIEESLKPSLVNWLATS
jgi:hypothetical protein